jgi:hypothetical protein
MNAFFDPFCLILLMISLLRWCHRLSHLKCGLQILICRVLIIELNTLFGDSNTLVFFTFTTITFLIESYFCIAQGCWVVLILDFDLWCIPILVLLILIFEVLIEFVSGVDDKWKNNNYWACSVHC